MAMVCVSGGRECSGCGRCSQQEQIYICPACGEELNEADTVYTDSFGNITGCEYCISRAQAYEAFEKFGPFEW